MEQMNKTRFQKKGVPKFPVVPGTKPSVYNFQLLTGTGIPALDSLIGGGLAVGTLLLIEDIPRSQNDIETEQGSDYSTVITKYFLSEGVYHGHSIFFGSCSEDPAKYLSNLPEIVTAQSTLEETEVKEKDVETNMKIAWRYKNQPSSSTGVQIEKPSHHFNLQRTLDKHFAERCKFHTWGLPGFVPDDVDLYQDLFRELHIISEQSPFTISSPEGEKNILRVALHGIGSLLWSRSKEELTRFIFALRSLARQHLSVIILTIPQEVNSSLIHKSPESLSRIRSLCDIVISLTPFSKKERRSGPFKDFHGVLDLVKVANVNCLKNPIHQNLGKYLFRSTKTKFLIEKMHLQPDLNDDEKKSSSGNALDF